MKILNDRIDKIIKGLIVLCLFYGSVYFQYIPFRLFNEQLSNFAGNTRISVLLSAFSDLILLFILICIYYKDLKEDFKIFKKDWKKNMDTGIACWVVGLIIMVLSNSILLVFFHANGANNENLVRSMIHSLPLIMGLNVCVLAPIIEEIVFRKTLYDVFKRREIFVFLSFLMFGYAHVSSMASTFVDWLYIIPYGALGGAFAFAYHKTNTIYTTICLHMMHNLFTFLLVLVI